ncbi:phosphatase PAP2 family protein [Metabacillus niabensis]|uniref:Undecaprenyl-diphosphatase n=1 Tax=Metabacillus niabensis TaxID=324854 RepID=A0ABT9Z777_9BACI|nr:phosphatase PAP2 family protein [Metabacillus niabensis]MDQ0227794.1 undecaprenyl-diphosphatase [Metabacillus niabensis]
MNYEENKVRERGSSYSTRIGLIIGLVALLVNVLMIVQLSATLIREEFFSFDKAVISTVRSFSSETMDVVMVFITELGSSFTLGTLLLVGMILLFLKRKDRLASLFFFLVVAGGGLVNSLLKNLFERERPNVNRLIEIDGFSFPSGHSMGSMLFYGFLVYLLFRSKQRMQRKIGLGILLSIIILLIGISRIYLGVHYPSDVLAGFIAGFIWLCICIIVLEAAYKWKK